MRANEVDSLHDTLGGGQVIDGPRRRRNQPPPRTSGRSRKPRYAEFGESDIEEDEEAEEEEEEEEDDFSKVGAEAEGGTDDDEEEDVEMEDAPMPPKAPKITLKPPAKATSKSAPKPKLIVTPANVGPVKTVEDQEMEDDPGDEEVEDSSDLPSDDEDEDEEEDEEDEEDVDETNLNEEDAEGEEDVGEGDAPGEDEEMEEDDEEDDDSSDETPASGAATPDPNKMTKRQRGRADDSGGLMALDMAPQQRKVRSSTCILFSN